MIKINDAEFDLLCYIREVAKSRANPVFNEVEMYVKVVIEILDNHVCEERKE
jgi:hypothetical protein